MQSLARGGQYANNTIVVLWSDHGYRIGEKEKLHKRALWSQSSRMPFLISVPGMELAGHSLAQLLAHPELLDDLLAWFKSTGALLPTKPNPDYNPGTAGGAKGKKTRKKGSDLRLEPPGRFHQSSNKSRSTRSPQITI